MRKLMIVAAVVLAACGPSRGERAFQEAGRFYRDGKLLEAIGLYRAALHHEPRNHAYRYSLGLALAQLGQHSEAQTLLSEVVAAQPENAEARRLLAVVNRCATVDLPPGLSPSTRALISGDCRLY